MSRYGVAHSLSLNYSLKQVSEFPVTDLKRLQLEAVDSLDKARQAKNFVDSAIDRKYTASLNTLRETLQKESGEVRFEEDGFTIVADIAKTVNWDQKALADIANNIRKNGNDPKEFLEISYSVSEQKYSGWPTHLRDSFAHSRTLSYDTQVIKILDP